MEKRDIEFRAWNEYVDNHFKELHFGISKVPPKLKFGNSALTYWAEKWSSLFGEWIYDELFGYVWRPADDRFAYAERPFFHADFMRVGDVLFLVPQQEWGWVPAHMGTWVWMKRGWTWIPGDWFHSGVVDYMGLYSYPIDTHYYSFPTFDYYWHRYWHAQPGWPRRTLDKRSLQKPVLPGLPEPVIGLLKKVGKVPASHEGRRLAVEKVGTPIEAVKLPRALPAPLKPRLQAPVRGAVVKAGSLPDRHDGGVPGEAASGVLKRDWNPDSRWAARRFVTIQYSGNAVKCPELKLSSDDLRGVERAMLRDSARASHSGYSDKRSQSGSSSSSTAGDRAAERFPGELRGARQDRRRQGEITAVFRGLMPREQIPARPAPAGRPGFFLAPGPARVGCHGRGFLGSTTVAMTATAPATKKVSRREVIRAFMPRDAPQHGEQQAADDGGDHRPAVVAFPEEGEAG